MGKITNIEWASSSWNPWMGCHKVSAGCKNCYMYREQNQYGNDPNTVRRSKTTFDAPLKWITPERIFTCSWSDFFIEEADEWRSEAWDIIQRTPQHTYLILTKRPERIRRCLPDDWFPRNVWWGVSIEDWSQISRWDIMDTELHYQNPPVLFISAEPLLGPLNLQDYFSEIDLGDEDHQWWTRSPDWIIVGGESGPGFRPMDLEWATSVVDQCQESGVPVFVKQLGGWPDKRHDITKFPAKLQVREFPEAK